LAKVKKEKYVNGKFEACRGSTVAVMKCLQWVSYDTFKRTNSENGGGGGKGRGLAKKNKSYRRQFKSLKVLNFKVPPEENLR
jgi:hypothetical protein